MWSLQQLPSIGALGWISCEVFLRLIRWTITLYLWIGLIKVFFSVNCSTTTEYKQWFQWVQTHLRRKRAVNSTGSDTCIPCFLWSQTDSIPKNLNYRSVALFCCYSELFVRWYKLFGLTGAVWRISSKTFYTAPWETNILQEERMMPKVFFLNLFRCFEKNIVTKQIGRYPTLG